MVKQAKSAGMQGTGLLVEGGGTRREAKGSRIRIRIRYEEQRREQVSWLACNWCEQSKQCIPFHLDCI